MSSSLQISDAAATAAGTPSAATVDDTYTFEHVPSFQPKAFTDLRLKDYWVKWGLGQRAVQQFRIGSKRFAQSEIDAFLLDLFNSDVVRQHFAAQDRRGSPVALGGKVASVKFDPLTCSATTMDMFDVFLEHGVVASIEPEDDEENGEADEHRVSVPKAGYIRRKMDEDIDGVTVSDMLKDSLLNEYADKPVDSLIDPDMGQKELLYQLFKWIVIGGGSCQPEEYWGPYLEGTKALYRDLTTVTKDPADGSIQVVSRAYMVSALRAEGRRELQLFPTDRSHNRLFVVVDPAKRLVTLLYSAFIPFW